LKADPKIRLRHRDYRAYVREQSKVNNYSLDP
jgi:hypothetical protein